MDGVDCVIDFFLAKEPMSPKKLQKMLYYAYAWTLTLLNDDENHLENKLFGDKFEAWVHGPVLPNVYEKYKEYGWNEIPKKTSTASVAFSPEVEDVLEQVWDVYGKMNGNQLESITHKEAPWIRARAGARAYEASHNEISDIEIFRFYNWQANRK